MKTKNKIIAIVLIILFIAVLVHIWYLYSEYGEWGLYGGFILYVIVFGLVMYGYISFKYPARRSYNRQSHDERVDIHIHDERNRHPVRRPPYQQDTRISPEFGERAKKFGTGWDVVDNRGYFGKKKRKR